MDSESLGESPGSNDGDFPTSVVVSSPEHIQTTANSQVEQGDIVLNITIKPFIFT